jgi:hypothetical protein
MHVRVARPVAKCLATSLVSWLASRCAGRCSGLGVLSRRGRSSHRASSSPAVSPADADLRVVPRVRAGYSSPLFGEPHESRCMLRTFLLHGAHYYCIITLLVSSLCPFGEVGVCTATGAAAGVFEPLIAARAVRYGGQGRCLQRDGACLGAGIELCSVRKCETTTRGLGACSLSMPRVSTVEIQSAGLAGRWVPIGAKTNHRCPVVDVAIIVLGPSRLGLGRLAGIAVDGRLAEGREAGACLTRVDPIQHWGIWEYGGYGHTMVGSNNREQAGLGIWDSFNCCCSVPFFVLVCLGDSTAVPSPVSSSLLSSDPNRLCQTTGAAWRQLRRHVNNFRSAT